MFATIKDAVNAVKAHVKANNIDAGKYKSSCSISRGLILVTFEKAKYTVKASGEIAVYVSEKDREEPFNYTNYPATKV